MIRESFKFSEPELREPHSSQESRRKVICSVRIAKGGLGLQEQENLLDQSGTACVKEINCQETLGSQG